MPNILTLKIDVRKLDKARFFEGKADANGHRPLYADLVLIPRKEKGKWGSTHIVKQSVTKEEREAKVEVAIIGDATERGGDSPSRHAPQAPAREQTPPPPPPANNVDDDIPF